jgi:hypothetical protein
MPEAQSEKSKPIERVQRRLQGSHWFGGEPLSPPPAGRATVARDFKSLVAGPTPLSFSSSSARRADEARHGHPPSTLQAENKTKEDAIYQGLKVPGNHRAPSGRRMGARAQVPPPASPSPRPPPGQPIGLTVRLDAATGSLSLRWKATNPANSLRQNVKAGSEQSLEPAESLLCRTCDNCVR